MSTFPLDDISPEVCQKFEPFFSGPQDIRAEYNLLKNTLEGCSKPLAVQDNRFEDLNDDIAYIKNVLNTYKKFTNPLHFVISCVYNLVRKFSDTKSNCVGLFKSHIDDTGEILKQLSTQLEAIKNKTKKQLKETQNNNEAMEQLKNLRSLANIIKEQNIKPTLNPHQNCKYKEYKQLLRDLVQSMIDGNQIKMGIILKELEEKHVSDRRNSHKNRPFSS